MKNIIVTSALLAVVSGSVYGNNPAMMMDNMYFKGEVFTGIGAKVTPSATHYGETTINGSGAVGFHAMEQVRAEILVSYLQTPEYKAADMKSEGWVAFLNGYVEAVDLGSAKFSVGGGLGVSWLESTLAGRTYPDDFAMSWNVGAIMSFEATPEAAIELSYRYANYGKPGTTPEVPAATAGGTPTAAAAWTYDNRASHNIGLGLRFTM